MNMYETLAEWWKRILSHEPGLSDARKVLTKEVQMGEVYGKKRNSKGRFQRNDQDSPVNPKRNNASAVPTSGVARVKSSTVGTRERKSQEPVRKQTLRVVR